MWRAEDPADDAALAPLTAALDAHGDFFDRARPLIVARAPGRLDVMGGIADYSGSLVLELPLAAATLVALQAADDGRVTVRSPAVAEIGAEPEVTVPLDTLAPNGVPLADAAARALLGADPGRRWAAYPLGTLLVLARAAGASLRGGVKIFVASSVPPGKGVSSSAALEVATARAAAELLGVSVSGRELALLCQAAENHVVGAPCGVMDQMTSACGEADRLLALRCQPAELEGHVALPADLALWGIDSGVRHEVGGADYGAVRVGAFMGYRIVADLAGLPARALGTLGTSGAGRVAVDDARWGGYLANVAPHEWTTRYRDAVPESLDGATFLARYGGTTDAATRVDPARTYAVRRPTAHPIWEHHRVRLFRALLAGQVPNDERCVLLGELMYQSHASYGACGLGARGTDRIVELVRHSGPEAGLYGAKITGGGSGGVVAVLARRDAEEAVGAVARAYERETGLGATMIGGSSGGAMMFGVRRVGWR